MGRTVIADEALGSYLKRFDHSSGFVVGLVLGQASKTTDYVIHLVRTPAPPPENENDKSDEQKESKKKKSKEAAQESITVPTVKDISEPYLKEHALQVTKMLPGGMWVLGLFLVGSTDPFSSQADCSRFRTILRNIRTHLIQVPSLGGDSPSSEKLLVYMNNQTKVITCRALALDGGGSFLQATWKFHKDPVVWQQVESILDMSQILYLMDSESSPPVKRPLQVFVNAIYESIKKSVYTIDGQLREADDLLVNGDKKRKKKSEESEERDADPKVLTANLYLPMLEPTKTSFEEGSFRCVEILSVIGSIAGRTYLNPKATADEAAKAIKLDLSRSLAARVEMHLDSLLEEEHRHAGGEPILHEPPRRMSVPLPYSAVTVSDYLFPGEGAEVALKSSREIFDLDVHASEVQDMEITADVENMQWKPLTTPVPNSCAPRPAPAPTLRRPPMPYTNYRQQMIMIVVVGAIICAYLAFQVQRYINSTKGEGSRRHQR